MMNSINIVHLDDILNNDLKDNKNNQLEICRKDIQNIFVPNPYELMWFNNQRTEIIDKNISIKYLYKQLKERTLLKSWNCFHHENVHRNIELIKSYIYVLKLVYQYKKLTFCKVLSSNFVNNTQLYHPDVIYNIFKD